MLTEWTRSINAILYQRISSPFWGSFLLGWIASNWKIIIVLFFTQSEELGLTKLEYIETNLLGLNNMLWQPLIFAFVIIFIGTALSYLVYLWSKWTESGFRKVKEKYDGKKKINIEEAKELRITVNKEKDRYASIFKDLNENIEKLSIENVQLDEKNVQLDEKEKDTTKRLNDLQDRHKNLNEKVFKLTGENKEFKASRSNIKKMTSHIKAIVNKLRNGELRTKIAIKQFEDIDTSLETIIKNLPQV